MVHYIEKNVAKDTDKPFSSANYKRTVIEDDDDDEDDDSYEKSSYTEVS